MSYRRYSGSDVIWALIGINIFLFLMVTIYPRLVPYLGLRMTLSVPWTMVTSMFLHTQFFHLLANMLTLYFFGTAVVTLVSTPWFLIVYFIGGLAGNALLLLLAPIFPFSMAYGASGAIFALGGVLAVMRPKLKVIVFPIPVPLPLWVAVIGGFVILSFLPGIAWQAHLGGLVVGLVAGYFFRKRERY